MNASQVLRRNVELLSTPCPAVHSLPSVERARRTMELVRTLIFPGYFSDCQGADTEMHTHYVGVTLNRLYNLLLEQMSPEQALGLIDSLPELRRVLMTDVEAIFCNDPAVDNRGEVIFCYPGVRAMLHYRVAHELMRLGVPVIPRIITELAHSATGIDIHPGATIGEYFAIDHGTGVVIGQTCIIGHHVTVYQGVTLGSRNFSYNGDGHPVNTPRHPIIEDYVTIYSNASVLGRITVGSHAVVGGNIWVTDNVAPYEKVTQTKYRNGNQNT